jgi:hypothetical protein
MSISELKFIKRCAEFQPRTEIGNIPAGTRGIYALLGWRPRLKKFDVVYIGMVRGLKSGIKGRLRSHASSVRKGQLWTHFSIYEVWDNISESEVAELEGLFRHIYRKDTRANRFNRQRSFKKLKNVRQNQLRKWTQVT